MTDKTTTTTATLILREPDDEQVAGERMLRHFAYAHLRPALATVSEPWCMLARHVVATIPAGPERTVALRKLLEGKDAAVRAVANP